MKKAKEYDERSDCIPETDLQDSLDHSCMPADPLAGTSMSPTKGNKVSV